MKLLVLMAAITPVVLNCCQPDKISGSILVTGYPSCNFMLDYTTHKMVLTPKMAAGPLKYILIDFQTEQSYKKLKTGQCLMSHFPFPGSYLQCLPINATDVMEENGMSHPYLSVYHYDAGGNSISVVMENSTCMPFTWDVTSASGLRWQVLLGNMETGLQGDTTPFDDNTDNCIASPFSKGIV